MDCDVLRDEVSCWLSEVLELLSCDAVDNLSLNKCKSLKKEELASKLFDALIFLKNRNDMLKQVKSETEALKTGLIGSQQNVIGLQSELLASKTEQLETLQATVKTSVEDTVKAEFVTYSAIVQKNHAKTLEPERLNSFVKQVVEDTDRSRSLIIFGLPEEVDEKLCEKVSSVFEDIGEKPRVETCRLGKQKSNIQGNARPVKVTLSSPTTVYQILTKAKTLYQVQDCIYKP